MTEIKRVINGSIFLANNYVRERKNSAWNLMSN